MNFAETASYRKGLEEAGIESSPATSGDADAYVVNTCAVTTHSENKCRNIIRRCHRQSPGAAIFVTGCYAELKRDEILAIEGVRGVFGKDEKKQLVPAVVKYLTGAVIQQQDSPAFSYGGRTRAFLKVQDGCDNFCAYCTVPFARGRSRNIPIESIVRQAGRIASEGIREIVLTGVNTGDFGRSTGESFLSLLKALDKVEGVERYRISSIEPNLITDGIIDWIASSGKFQPHFHIPLQSGSDQVLKAVGRRYDTGLFADRIERIRSVMEGPGKLPVFFGIDVIAGLPGETDGLFEDSCRFLESINPAFLHVFPFSPRPGTRALTMPGQVQESVRTERAAVLAGMSARFHSAFLEKCRGLRAEVLWEKSEKDGLMSGYTGNYIRLQRPYEKQKINTLESVII